MIFWRTKESNATVSASIHGQVVPNWTISFRDVDYKLGMRVESTTRDVPGSSNPKQEHLEGVRGTLVRKNNTG